MSEKSTTAFSKLSAEDKQPAILSLSKGTEGGSREIKSGGTPQRPKNWRFSGPEAEDVSQKLARIQDLHGALSQLESGTVTSPVTVGAATITIGTAGDPYNDRLTTSMATAVKAEIRDQIAKLSHEVAEDVSNAGYPQPEPAAAPIADLS